MEQQVPESFYQPPPLQSPSPVDPPSEVSQPSTIRKKILLGLGVLFALILFLLSSTAVWATYFPDHFPLPQNIRRGLSLAFYYVPFTPKTAEQILLIAADRNTSVTSYIPDFSFSTKLEASNVSLFTLDLVVKGPIDLTPNKKPAMDLAVQAATTMGGNRYDVKAQVKKVEDNYYFKISELPELFLSFYSPSLSRSALSEPLSDEEKKRIKKEIDTVLKNWIVYDTSGLESEARDNLDKKETDSLLDKSSKETKDFLLKQNILRSVKVLKDEKIHDVNTYHLQFVPTKSQIKKMFLDYLLANKKYEQNSYVVNPDQTLSELADAIENVQIDLFLGKRDLIVRKLTLTSDVNLSFLQKDGSFPTYLLGIPNFDEVVSPRLRLSTALVAKDVNKPVTVEKPSQTLSFEEFSEKLAEAGMTEAEKEQVKIKKGYQSDLREFSRLLSSYKVKQGLYPTSLSQLEITSSSPLYQKLSSYQYRRSTNGLQFLLYTTYSSSDYYNDTPYYGVTSSYSTPHQLSSYEFDYLNRY